MTYTKQNARVPSIQIETMFQNGSGTALSVNVTAHLESVLVNDGDSEDSFPSPRKRVLFDLIDPLLAAQNITAGGKTVTYQQLAALLRQATLDRANAQGIA